MTDNKKTYVKPDFTMMRFNLSDNIATSGCTSSSSSTTTYKKQLIECIIDGEEYVFYTKQACGNAVTSGYLGTYNGQTYFVWYDGNVTAKPSDEETALLSAIEEAVGASSAIGHAGWHAGIASADVSTIWSSSY